MAPRAGLYRHQVKVLTATTVPNTIGTPKRSWAVAFTKWAAVEVDYRPTDQFAATANTQIYETRVWFKMRKTSRITMQHRLRYDGKDYEILSIQDPEGRNQATKILGREVKP